MNKEESSDYIVGELVGLSMFISLLFLILQVLAWIPCMIIIVLVERGIIPKSQEGLIFLAVFVLAELTLVWRIIVHVRKKCLPIKLSQHDKHGRGKPFKEEYLERGFNIIACIGIVWVLLLGMHMDSVRYLLIVIQGFGVLFFMIFFVVRLLVTKRFAYRTLFSVLLSGVSIWMTIKNDI